MTAQTDSSQIDLSKLPATIDNRFVGITFEHMDFINYMRIAHEANARISDSLYHKLQYSFVEIERRDTLIQKERQLKTVLLNENEILNGWNQKQGDEILALHKEIKKHKRRIVFAWIVAIVPTATVAVVSLSK